MRIRTSPALAACLLAVGACADSPVENEVSGSAEHNLTKGYGGVSGVDTNYCDRPSFPCIAGESDCDSDTQCLGALVCGVNNGPQFGFGDQWDVCVEAHCTNGILDADESLTDCGGADCGPICASVCDSLPPPPAVGACSSDCPCAEKEADCNADDECVGALVCGVNNGDQFGLGTNWDVCVKPHCVNGILDPGELTVDCGGPDCGTSCGMDCGSQPPSGDANRCSISCVCEPRDGDCDSDMECASGGICVDNIGASFGFDRNTDVCLASTCINSVQDGDETGVDCGPSCEPCAGSAFFMNSHGTGGRVVATSSAVDSTGATIIAGYFFDSTNLGGSTFTRVGTSVTTTDIFIAKYDVTGAHVWSQAFGSPASDGNLAVEVAVGPSNEIALAGNFNQTINFGTGAMTAAGRVDAFVAVYESNGTARWAQGWGGTEIDATYDVQFESTGDVVAVGGFQLTANFGSGAVTSSGASDIFAVRLSNATGATLASTTFGGPGEDVGRAIATQNTRVYIGGGYRDTVTFGPTTTTSAGASDGFVVELDGSSLAVMRSRFFGGTNVERVLGLDSDAATQIYATGIFGSSVDFGSIPKTSNGGLDVYVMALSGTLVPIWVVNYGGTSNDEGLAIAVNDSSRVAHVTGYLTGDAMFSTGNSPGLGLQDAFLISLDQTGTPTSEERHGGSDQDIGFGVHTAAGRIGYAGSFRGSATIAGTALVSSGSNDVFVGTLAD